MSKYSKKTSFVAGLVAMAAGGIALASGLPQAYMGLPTEKALARGGDVTVQLGFDAAADVSAIQFEIHWDEGEMKGKPSFDLSQCGARLPASHIGGCKEKSGHILFWSFSTTNAVLPSGTLGEITFSGVSKGFVESLQLRNEVMANSNGVGLTEVEMYGEK